VVSETQPSSQQTVLVVEDDRPLREFFATTLAIAGYRVIQADDGVAALRLVEADPPDLVVLDLYLPTLDGFSVRDEIWAHTETRNIPIVIVTGSAVTGRYRVRDECILRKPVMPEQLLHVVRLCLAA
jgi:DNA-binding response OmpR family regulator